MSFHRWSSPAPLTPAWFLLLEGRPSCNFFSAMTWVKEVKPFQLRLKKVLVGIEAIMSYGCITIWRAFRSQEDKKLCGYLCIKVTILQLRAVIVTVMLPQFQFFHLNSLYVYVLWYFKMLFWVRFIWFLCILIKLDFKRRRTRYLQLLWQF